ncbi:hypothetical protein KIPB_016101, partial [Kipferlia bialata]
IVKEFEWIGASPAEPREMLEELDANNGHLKVPETEIEGLPFTMTWTSHSIVYMRVLDAHLEEAQALMSAGKVKEAFYTMIALSYGAIRCDSWLGDNDDPDRAKKLIGTAHS